jgi:hypothetical protein
VLLLSAVGWARLFAPGFPFTYDGDVHVARSLHLEHELRQGQFPVRWGSDQVWGYGYPTFNFYNPLPYYLAAGLHLAGVPATRAIEVVLAASLVTGALFMALWARRIWGTAGGLVAAVLYALSPAVLQATYLVMSPGEVIVIGLLPVAGWMLHRGSVSSRPLVWFAPTGCVAALMVVAHNFLGPIALAVLAVYGILLALIARKAGPAWQAAGVIVAALLLSAFFWLPGYVELRYTRAGDERLRFEPATELFNLGLGPRISQASALATEAHARDTLGVANMVAVVLGTAALVTFWRRASRSQRAHLGAALAGFLVLVTMMIMPSKEEVWQALPVLRQAQYSARLLTVVALPAAIAAGSITLWTWSRPLLIALLVGSAIIYGFGFGRPVHSQRGDDLYFLRNQPLLRGTADWDHTVLPKWAAIDPRAPVADPQPALSPDTGQVLRYDRHSTRVHLLVDTPVAATLTVPIFYFPGWEATVDGTSVTAVPAETPVVTRQPEQSNGLSEIAPGSIVISVPAGRHDIELRFTDTPVRRAGNLISLISLLAVVGAGAASLSLGRKIV